MTDRCTYKLLSALADYREQEKDMPEGVDSALSALEGKLKSTPEMDKGAGSEGKSLDDDRATAKERAAEKFRQSGE